MMTASRFALVAAISLTVVSAAAAQDAPAAEAMGKAPTWINLVASILCGLVTMASSWSVPLLVS